MVHMVYCIFRIVKIDRFVINTLSSFPACKRALNPLVFTPYTFLPSYQPFSQLLHPCFSSYLRSRPLVLSLLLSRKRSCCEGFPKLLREKTTLRFRRKNNVGGRFLTECTNTPFSFCKYLHPLFRSALSRIRDKNSLLYRRV